MTALSKNTMITSLEIAQEFGKEHFHVRRDIRMTLSRFEGLSVFECQYEDHEDRVVKMYEVCIRTYALLRQRYSGVLRHSAAQEEAEALGEIENTLGYGLERQFRVLSYRIDGYDPRTNTVYEVDGEYHRYGRHKEYDEIREAAIIQELGCNFIRIPVSSSMIDDEEEA